MMRLLLAVSLCAGWVLHGAEPAQAQSYPNRPIRMVVPFPAGGPTDAMARIISDRLGAGPRSDHRGREPRRRRRRQHRRQSGRDRRSRRLHAPHHAGRRSDDRPGGARQYRLRPGQGLRAGLRGDGNPAGRVCSRVAAGEVDGGAGQLRQGQSRQDLLGVARLRHRATPPGRAFQDRGGREHRPCALSRNGSDARRHRGERGAGGRRSDDHQPAAYPIGEVASRSPSPSANAVRNCPTFRP